MKSLTGLWWEDLIERNHLENLGVDGGIILKYIIKKWNGWAMDWIAVADESAGGGRGNEIKEEIETVPRNVGYQSSDDALQQCVRTKTKSVNNSNVTSGYIPTGEAVLRTQSHKNIR